MSATNTSTPTLTTPFGTPPTSTDPTPSPTLDPINGPSVYLYGFLATLVLIFLVSICVAWKGYRTRRLLRARIDEAIARGVLVPGYDPSNPNLPWLRTPGERWRLVQSRPVLFEEWIGEGEVVIKPTSLDALRPYNPPAPPQQPHSTNPHSLLTQLLDPLRHYWFVQPREGTDPTEYQGRRRGRRGTRRGRRDTDSSNTNTNTPDRSREGRGEKVGGELEGVREVMAGVLIAMPDRVHPRWPGIGTGGYAAVPSGSRPASWVQQQQAAASGSRSASSSAVRPAHGPSSSVGTAVVVEEEEERRELPELVLGVVAFDVKGDEEEVAMREVGVDVEGVVDAGKGKEVERGE